VPDNLIEMTPPNIVHQMPETDPRKRHQMAMIILREAARKLSAKGLNSEILSPKLEEALRYRAEMEAAIRSKDNAIAWHQGEEKRLNAFINKTIEEHKAEVRANHSALFREQDRRIKLTRESNRKLKALRAQLRRMKTKLDKLDSSVTAHPRKPNA